MKIITLATVLLLLTQVSIAKGQSSIFIPADQHKHEIGTRTERRGWVAAEGSQRNKFLSFGPYLPKLTSGKKSVTFTLVTSDITKNNDHILTLDVTANQGKTTLASRKIYRRDFKYAHAPHEFVLLFTNVQALRKDYEFRVRWHGGAEIEHVSTRITEISPDLDYTCMPRLEKIPQPKNDPWGIKKQNEILALFNLQKIFRSRKECRNHRFTTGRGVNLSEVNGFLPEMVGRANLRTARITFYWANSVEEDGFTLREEYFSMMEKTLSQIILGGTDPLIVVHAAPAKFSFQNRAEAYVAFSKYMALVVRRFPNIRYWQLFNEMDAAFTDLFGAKEKQISLLDKGRFYTEMLKVTYPAMKSANPRAQVVMGPVAVPTTEFMEGVYLSGGREFFDIASLHLYGLPVHNKVVVVGTEFRKLMHDYGDETKELWNTEFGLTGEEVLRAWGESDRTETLPEYLDRIQLEVLQKCLEYSEKYNIFDRTVFFSLNFGQEEQHLPEKYAERVKPLTIYDFGFTLLRTDWKTPRPAMLWLMGMPLKSSFRFGETVTPTSAPRWMPPTAVPKGLPAVPGTILPVSPNFLSRASSTSSSMAPSSIGRGKIYSLTPPAAGGVALEIRELDLQTQEFISSHQKPWAQPHASEYSGWMDEKDRLVIGNFRGPGQPQFLFLNSERKDGSFLLLELAASGNLEVVFRKDWSRILSTTYPDWTDSGTRILAADFLGKGSSQLLFFGTYHAKEAIHLQELNPVSKTFTTIFVKRWGELSASTYTGFLDPNDRLVAGDFLGSGKAQLLFINGSRAGAAYLLQEYDATSRSFVTRALRKWSELPPGAYQGFTEETDRILSAPFSGGKKAQLLFIDSASKGAGMMLQEYNPKTNSFEKIFQKPVPGEWLKPATRVLGH